MQDQINLDEITDVNELNRLYVACNEALLQHEQIALRERQNMEMIRNRMGQVQQSETQPSTLDAEIATGESQSADNPGSTEQ